MFTKLTTLKTRVLSATSKRIAAIDKSLKIIKENNLNVKTGAAITMRAILVTNKANLENWEVPTVEKLDQLACENNPFEVLKMLDIACFEELLTAMEDDTYPKLSHEMFAAMSNLPFDELSKIDLTSLI